MKPQRPAILFIFITLLLDVTGFGIIIPVMPALISGFTGGNTQEAASYGGWLLFAFSVMQFLFSPVLGNLSDRYGRRPVLLFSLLGFGLDYLLLAFAPSLSWLFVGRIIAGITGASFTTAGAYIADVSTPETRAKNFGMIGAAFGLGFILGPALGGFLGRFGTQVPFYTAAGLTLLNVLYGFFILPESLKPENRRPFDWRRANPLGSFQSLGKYPGLLGLVVAIFFMHTASHAVQSTWSFFTIGEFAWTPDQVGYSLAFVGILVASVQTGLVRLSNQVLGQKKSIYTGLFFFAFGLLVFAFADQGWMMYAGLIPYCLSGVAGPTIQALMSTDVPPNAQGELQGAITSTASLASIVGPPVMTNLYGHFGSPQAIPHFPGAAFLLGSGLALCSLFLAFLNLRGRFRERSSG